MYFEIIGGIEKVEIIAVGGNIRDIMRLRKQYGTGRWRKLKGIAAVKLDNGNNMYSGSTLVRSAWYRQAENEDQEIIG